MLLSFYLDLNFFRKMYEYQSNKYNTFEKAFTTSVCTDLLDLWQPYWWFQSPTRNGGETKMTPSPLTNSIGIFLFVVCCKTK